jgi:hypothetical protein
VQYWPFPAYPQGVHPRSPADKFQSTVPDNTVLQLLIELVNRLIDFQQTGADRHLIAIFKQEEKDIAAVACHGFIAPQLSAERLINIPKCPVSFLRTVHLVDHFKVLDIH